MATVQWVATEVGSHTWDSLYLLLLALSGGVIEPTWAAPSCWVMLSGGSGIRAGVSVESVPLRGSGIRTEIISIGVLHLSR